jgi:hypothetical protein
VSTGSVADLRAVMLAFSRISAAYLGLERCMPEGLQVKTAHVCHGEEAGGR